MSTSANWRDVKSRARAADPEWDGADRAARRAEMREQLGLRQAQLAEGTGAFAGPDQPDRKRRRHQVVVSGAEGGRRRIG
jgi:hypothetical protein